MMLTLRSQGYRDQVGLYGGDISSDIAHTHTQHTHHTHTHMHTHAHALSGLPSVSTDFQVVISADSLYFSAGTCNSSFSFHLAFLVAIVKLNENEMKSWKWANFASVSFVECYEH